MQAVFWYGSYVDPVTTLTKSLFTAGQQCHKLLWWKVHEPGAPELQPDKVLQDRFDQGAQVGALAQRLLPDGSFERTFEAPGIRIRTDILLEDEKGTRLIEVKSSSSVKPEHIPDAAVQAWVLKENGVEVTGVEIMHLNKEFKHPDQGALLVRTDVTAQVTATMDGIPDEVARQLAMLDGPLPERAIGIHCESPRECPFHSRCWPAARDHIAKLHSLGPIKTAAQMAAGRLNCATFAARNDRRCARNLSPGNGAREGRFMGQRRLCARRRHHPAALGCEASQDCR